MMKKKLFRSRRVRTISGVAGGLAEYLHVDVSLVRLMWVIGTIFTGVLPGVALYLIATIVIPEEEVIPFTDSNMHSENDTHSENTGSHTEVFSSDDASDSSHSGALVFGGFLILIGGSILLQKIIPNLIQWSFVGPVILIVLGILIVTGAFNKKSQNK